MSLSLTELGFPFWNSSAIDWGKYLSAIPQATRIGPSHLISREKLQMRIIIISKTEHVKWELSHHWNIHWFHSQEKYFQDNMFIIPSRCKTGCYLAWDVFEIGFSCSFKQSWNVNVMAFLLLKDLSLLLFPYGWQYLFFLIKAVPNYSS